MEHKSTWNYTHTNTLPPIQTLPAAGTKPQTTFSVGLDAQKRWFPKSAKNCGQTGSPCLDRDGTLRGAADPHSGIWTPKPRGRGSLGRRTCPRPIHTPAPTPPPQHPHPSHVHARRVFLHDHLAFGAQPFIWGDEALRSDIRTLSASNTVLEVPGKPAVLLCCRHLQSGVLWTRNGTLTVEAWLMNKLVGQQPACHQHRLLFYTTRGRQVCLVVLASSPRGIWPGCQKPGRIRRGGRGGGSGWGPYPSYGVQRKNGEKILFFCKRENVLSLF